MGRRKKESPGAHRETIASAAGRLFGEKGITGTSMDDIAKAADYSKATLYVYFKNKEEIVNLLTLESMRKLYGYLASALERQGNVREKYEGICQGLVRYQEEFPLYFQMALDKIRVDMEDGECLPEERETYQVGEKINEKLQEFLLAGMEAGALRKDIEVMPTLLLFWGMLSGAILLADSKEAYLRKACGLSREDFLARGFAMLYRAIAKEEIG